MASLKVLYCPVRPKPRSNLCGLYMAVSVMVVMRVMFSVTVARDDRKFLVLEGGCDDGYDAGSLPDLLVVNPKIAPREAAFRDEEGTDGRSSICAGGQGTRSSAQDTGRNSMY